MRDLDPHYRNRISYLSRSQRIKTNVYYFGDFSTVIQGPVLKDGPLVELRSNGMWIDRLRTNVTWVSTWSWQWHCPHRNTQGIATMTPDGQSWSSTWSGSPWTGVRTRFVGYRAGLSLYSPLRRWAELPSRAILTPYPPLNPPQFSRPLQFRPDSPKSQRRTVTSWSELVGESNARAIQAWLDRHRLRDSEALRLSGWYEGNVHSIRIAQLNKLAPCPGTLFIPRSQIHEDFRHRWLDTSRLPRDPVQTGEVSDLTEGQPLSRPVLNVKTILRDAAASGWDNPFLEQMLQCGVPLLDDLPDTGILLLPDQTPYLEHRGFLQDKQLKERARGFFSQPGGLLPRFPCIVHPKGAVEKGGKYRITNNFSAPHSGHRDKVPDLPLSYNESVRTTLEADTWPGIRLNRPTDIGQALWVLAGGFEEVKMLKDDVQSYFRLLSVSPRRECIQLWATEVGILVDSQGEFGPADMPDFASQLSDFLAHEWGNRVERELLARDFYETNTAAKDFRAARVHLGPKQSRCHVESIYVDDVHGIAPPPVNRIQASQLSEMCGDYDIDLSPTTKGATDTPTLEYTGFDYDSRPDRLRMGLPAMKRNLYVTELQRLASRKSAPRSEIESAVGRCIHAATVVPEGKADLEHLYRCLIAAPHTQKMCFLSHEARAELTRWADRLSEEVHVPLFPIHRPPPESDPTTLTIRVDASLREEGSGGGFGWWSANTLNGVLSIHYGLGDWTPAEASRFSSAAAELWAMLLAVASAAEHGVLQPNHTHVLIITDSEAAWGAILHNTRSSSQMEQCKGAWWKATSLCNTPVFPEHRPREWNQGADMLSKRDVPGFIRLATWYGADNVTHLPVPPHWRDTSSVLEQDMNTGVTHIPEISLDSTSNRSLRFHTKRNEKHL